MVSSTLEPITTMSELKRRAVKGAKICFYQNLYQNQSNLTTRTISKTQTNGLFTYDPTRINPRDPNGPRGVNVFLEWQPRRYTRFNKDGTIDFLIMPEHVRLPGRYTEIQSQGYDYWLKIALA